jgi:hypothetical protein
MIAGFVYTLGFSVFKAAKSNRIGKETFDMLAENRKRVTLELTAAFLVSLFISQYTSLKGAIYFSLMLGLIVLFRLLKAIETSEMKTSIPISELEPGDVVQTDQIEMEHVRQENFVGSIIARIEKYRDSRFLEGIRKRYGYSEIVGVTSEEIERLEDQNVESVQVKEGVRFVPVFPVALLLTDTVGLGVFFVSNFIN